MTTSSAGTGRRIGCNSHAKGKRVQDGDIHTLDGLLAPAALFEESVRQIIVVGGGLIGGSLSEAARKRFPNVALRLAETDAQTRRLAAASGLYQGVHASLRETPLQDHTLVVLACPLSAYEKALPELALSFAEAFPSEYVYVTDVGSVKSYVREAFRRYIPALLGNAVGAHPVAGSERSGFAARDGALFEGRQTIVCPVTHVSARAQGTIRAFWGAISGEIVSMSGEAHDRIYATVSHLTQLLAFALYLLLKRDGTLPLFLAKGRPYARLFASSPVLWRDVFRFNNTALREALDAYRETLAQTAGRYETQGENMLKPFLASHLELVGTDGGERQEHPCGLFEYMYFGSLFRIAAPFCHYAGPAFKDCMSVLRRHPPAEALWDDRLPPFSGLLPAADIADSLLSRIERGEWGAFLKELQE
jgi:prephenate dehydrogenase